MLQDTRALYCYLSAIQPEIAECTGGAISGDGCLAIHYALECQASLRIVSQLSEPECRFWPGDQRHGRESPEIVG